MAETRPTWTIRGFMIATAVAALVLAGLLRIRDMRSEQWEGLLMIVPIALYLGLRMVLLRLARAQRRAEPSEPASGAVGAPTDGSSHEPEPDSTDDAQRDAPGVPLSTRPREPD